MGWLQQDRINVALAHYTEIKNNKQDDEILWYLSGGVKNAIENLQITSEAEIMSESLNFHSNVILDTNATNTAENFRNFSEFVSKLGYDVEMVVVTSKFHKPRAEKFFYGFFPPDARANWVLGELACATCAQDEIYHMSNVQADINKALRLI